MMNQQLKRFFKATTLALLISSSVSVFATTNDEVVAVVGDSAILRSDLDQLTTDLSRQLQAQKLPIPSQQELQQQALSKIILNQAQLELVKRYNIQPSESEIDAAVLDYANKQGMQTLTAFQSRLDAQYPGAYQTVRQRIAQQLAINILRQQQIMSRIHISDQDVTNFLNTPQGQAAIGSQAHLLHLRVSGTDATSAEALLSVANQVKAALTLSDNIPEISRRFSKDGIKVEGADMGDRSLADIPAELAARAAAIQPGQTSELIPARDGIHVLKLLDRKASDKKVMVEQYHVRHILIQPSEVLTAEQAKQKIDIIYKRLKSGEDFATLASTFSNDPGSAADGGDLGWVMPGTMVPQFEDEMKSTPKGQISKPFQSQFGWHILQVIDTRQQDMTQEYQRRLARQYLGEQQFDTELDGWLRELRANTYVQIKDPSLDRKKSASITQTQ
ncbi:MULTISPECIES: peptidylprolyl isomerase [Acinetobacter]|uniref:Chaperone SurA n=2 Tax=Gammaproteobacteria TaxID=1236 RepID=A0ABU6DRA6_9GAMM|nr:MULTISPECIES: peptidylprolyl isomerase [Acinetobacter]MBF7689487.1 peptidylprolyl isomerase [Acinetobacter pollinis]MBF7692133.1 peptidylprolyl isomerase [Acinetobacter pollinis]MBF7696918.1 peptidylprolyl isomerase [Acinetobacter pollinis]MBF7700310.1 peptidylprolyl isomerase [Acinetobacter pollinis]MEB5476192.1 peptidylprolyl isomerase [Acinetobacter pollinis]